MSSGVIDALKRRREMVDLRIDLKTIPVPLLYEPVTPGLLAEVEELLGQKVPMFLGRIYSEVGNGGFGPGAGLLGLPGGYTDDKGNNVVEKHRALAVDGWPPNILPMNDWGDGAWSCVDCSTEGGVIITSDEGGFTRTRFELEQWFDEWSSGTDLFREIFDVGEATIINPFTQKSMKIGRRIGPKGERVKAFHDAKR